MSDKPGKVKLNKKDSQQLIRIGTAEREQFVRLCEQRDTTAAREIRQFIRGFIKKHRSTEKPLDFPASPWVSFFVGFHYPLLMNQ